MNLEMRLISDEWKNCQVPRALDRFRKLALVHGADSAYSSWKYLASFRNEVRQQPAVFEIDVGDLFGAEFADSPPSNAKPSWSWHAVTFLSLDYPGSPADCRGLPALLLTRLQALT
jgi:hypothetical protein